MEQIDTLLANHPWAARQLDRLFHVLVIIAVVFACAKLIQIVCGRILSEARKSNSSHEREKRLATVVKLVGTSLRVVLYGAALMMILREFGLDITPLLTGAGVAGVALGFGSQSLVRDMISGFFILIEDQIRVGDVIKINGGLAGSVERMELRVTAIRDGDGTLHVIPNGEIKSVSNMTYEFSTAVVDIPLPFNADLKRASEALSEMCLNFEKEAQWSKQIRGKTELLGVTKFEADHMVLQITVKTEPHARWGIARELRGRVKQALDGVGVSMPLSVMPRT